MCGKFENVKVLTCDERKNKQGENYFLYNVLSDGKIYNLYSKELFEISPDVETDISIELSVFNGKFNCKLVGVS